MIKWMTMPIRAVIVLADKIREEIDKEMYSIPYIQQQLLLLYTRHEMDDIEENEFLKQEAELLYRLKAARERAWEQLQREDNADDE